MNYAEMSDFEINRAVFMATGIDYEDISDVPIGGGSAIAFGDGCKWREYDFCNNPSDMWPLIIDNEISILAGKEGSSLAFHGVKEDAYYKPCGYDFSFSCKNALRAAAIVYLMMKEAGK